MCDWNRMKPIRISDIWVDIESTLTIASLNLCGRYTFQFSEKTTFALNQEREEKVVALLQKILILRR
jgi:hypothetical protein